MTADMLEVCRINGLVSEDGTRAVLATIASAMRKSANDPLPDLRAARSAMDEPAAHMNGIGSKTWQMFRSFGKFCMSEHGLFVRKGDEDVKVSAPFEVRGRMRSPDGTGWARLIRFYDGDGIMRTARVAMPTCIRSRGT